MSNQKIKAKYKRDPGMIIICRTVSRPLRIATRTLYDPIEDKRIYIKRVYKKGISTKNNKKEE